MLGRVVAEGEQLWLAEDTEAVLEHLRRKALLCPGCGLSLEETLDPENEGAYEATALRCHACGARDRKAKEFSLHKHESGGLFFTVERRS